MRIQSLTLKNFRRFENLQVDFQLDKDGAGGLTVFVAKNGEGKTSILDAINIAWGTFIGAMPNASGGVFKASDPRIATAGDRDAARGTPVVESTFIVPGFESPIVVERSVGVSQKKISTTTRNAKELANYAQTLLNAPRADREWPVLAYYGDGRLWSSERVTQLRIANVLTESRAFGYANATNPNASYKEFSLWFPALEFIVFVEEQRRKVGDLAYDEARLRLCRAELSLVKRALETALLPVGRYEIDSDVANGIWAFDLERKSKIPVDSLSAGVKIILGLIGDLSFRCVKLNPHLADDALIKTPGVVLIDEVELHLHPEWQQVVLPTLRSIFPNIQFIVTTHSPQVITSVPRESVRIISNGMVETPVCQTQGVESQDALLGVFGVDPAPNSDEFVVRLDEYDAMARAGQAESDAGKRLYRALRDHFGDAYPPLERIEINRKYRAKVNALEL